MESEQQPFVSPLAARYAALTYAAPPPLRRGPAALTYAAPPPLRRGPATLTYAAPPPLRRGPDALTSRPRRPYVAAPPPLPPRPRRPYLRGPAALTYAASSPLPARPRRPYVTAPPPSRCGPAASPTRPRRPYLRGPAALTYEAPSPLRRRPAALTSRPRRPHLRSAAALTSAASPPVPTRPRRLHLRGPTGLPSCRAARAAARRAARYRSSRSALQQLPSRDLADPLSSSRRAAEPQYSRAAQQQPPSRRAAEPQYRRAAPPAEPRYCRAARPALSAIDFEVWVFDLQLFLQCDRADGLSLFDLTSPAPAADADPIVRSQWANRDGAARPAVRRHLPTAERAHFSQYKSAQTLYDAVVARYSSPATAALSRLMLPFLFPDLAAFPTVADLITHLRSSDTRYRAALPADFCAKNPPPPWVFSFPSLCPLSPLPLRPTSLALSRSVRRVPLAGDVALARARGAREQVRLAGAVAVAVEAAEGVGVAVEEVVGVGVQVVAVEAEAASAAAVLAGVEAVAEVEVEVVKVVGVALHSGAALGVVSTSSSSSSSVLATSPPLSSSVSGTRSVSVVGDLVPAPTSFAPATVRQFPETTEIPRWGELSRAGVAIFYLDFDAILAAMYAVTISDEGDCYRCFTPDPGIETAALGTGETAALGTCDAAALGASVSASSGTGESALSGTTSASASHAFTLDSGASRSFFRDRTTLTPLSRPVAVSLADPSGGPVLSRFSTVLPCPAAPSGTLSGLYLPPFSTNLVIGADLQDAGVHQFTPPRQRVTHCTEASTGRHLATFTRQPGSSLYTLTTASHPVTESGRVPASGQVFAAASRSGPESAPCSCRLLSHETLLWHHRLGHPSLLRLRSMASRLLVSGLPRSLPPLPQGPGPTCVPCVEGRQRAASHSSQFPPTEAPLQTLHLDVWGPARVRGQGHERYFLLVVDDYSRYTTLFPLRSKGDVTEVLIDWIRAARLQLRQSFGSDFPVLRLHSDRGGEFSSGLLRAYCRARGIRQTFTLPDSPQQNGIAERRIGMVMDVARTSMMHAAAPHFLWPFAVRYAAHQINLHPRVSRPETSPALLWTGKVGDASAFRVWGSRAFVRDLSADKLSPRAAPCVFLGFPPDAPGWQFCPPRTSRPPTVDPLPPQGPAPSDVSQVDEVEPVEVTGDSGAAAGAEPRGAVTGGAEPGGAEPGGAEPWAWGC
ncbi:unnamed protein product [Closterium sp. NIES-64]|nr:unnamed protein product [Closterium sp. NIES-64]